MMILGTDLQYSGRRAGVNDGTPGFRSGQDDLFGWVGQLAPLRDEVGLVDAGDGGVAEGGVVVEVGIDTIGDFVGGDSPIDLHGRGGVE